MIIKTSWDWPVSGIWKVWTAPVSETPSLAAPVLLLILTFCPVLNGWFGMRIVLVGIDTFSFISPTIYSVVWALPGVVPTPTDCGPLK